VHRHGQTFVTWKDLAEGEAGAKYRYSVFRSERPINVENLFQAQLCCQGVLNNSAKLFGSAFSAADRLDPAKPYSLIEESGKPLPPWSGLAVITADRPRQAYYAILATDEKWNPVSHIVPGRSATTQPVEEQPAPIRPIKLYDSTERGGPYVRSTSITGTSGLPLHITLHGSNSRGGGAGDYGDYFLYFGTPQMGFRDGLPGVFSVEEHRKPQRLLLRPRDALEHPSGQRNMESYWFGYHCRPQWAHHEDSRFYPFTEARLVWMISWAVEHYGADPNRITMGGSSSGGVGSMNVGFQHPELLAAVYPSVARVRKVPAVSLEGRLARTDPVLMDDGQTSYFDRADGPKFAAEHPEDLPFLGWACGRQDGYATWQEHIDMVRVMTQARHGFAFAWNNGNHGGGGRAMQQIQKYYPPEKFARNRSYPAFSHSSIDHDMGSGDPADGDLEGGINLGFDWTDARDEADTWSARISNELAREAMTVDITPRRCQNFKPTAGEAIRWTASTGESGSVVADPAGLVTIPRVRILAGTPTLLTLSRSQASCAARIPGT
jgi:hypothetical protein